MTDNGPALARAEPEPAFELVSTLAALAESAPSYVASARAGRTLVEYAKQRAAFPAWCDQHDLCDLLAALQTLTIARPEAIGSAGGLGGRTMSSRLVLLGSAPRLTPGFPEAVL